MKNILTFDIEDNFTQQELICQSDWDVYEKQVVENTQMIVNLLWKHNIKATFFILGKVAERRPGLIALILRDGHEIASHGYIHERTEKLGRGGFIEDITKSKKILESISGKLVKGFRAMAFSINTETVWAISYLEELGFHYDSSIFASHFTEKSDVFDKHFSNSFCELPPSTFTLLGKSIAFGGGIFFRLAPLWIIRHLINKENAKGRPVILYAHAWEFNKDQPRRKVSLFQSLAQSPLTYTTPYKLERLLKEFSFTSIEKYLESAK